MDATTIKKGPRTTLRRVLKIVLKVTAGVVALLVLLAGLMLWRLASGPVNIDFVTPRVEELFARTVADHRLQIDDTVVRWDRKANNLELRAEGIGIIGPHGNKLAGVPAVDMKLRVPALLRGVFAVSEARIEGAWLALVRDRQGEIHIGIETAETASSPTVSVAAATDSAITADTPSADQVATAPAQADENVIANILQVLLAAPERDRPETYLQKLELTDARLDLHDELLGLTWGATQVKLKLARSREGLRGELDFAVPARSHTLTCASQLVYRSDEQVIRIEGQLDDLWLPVLGTAMASEFLQSVDYLCRGSIGLETNQRGLLQSLDFDMTAAAGGEAMAAAALTIRGEGQTQGEHLRIATTATITDLPLETLADIWPATLAPGAHLWVTGNIPTGQVTEAEARVVIHLPNDLNGPPKFESLVGTLDYEDLEVHFLRPLPPVRALTGRGTFDIDSFHFVAGDADLLDLAVDSVQVDITGLSSATDALVANLNLQGPIRTALTLLDDPKLDLISWRGLRPEQTSGELDTRARISVPLRGKITLSNAGLFFQGNLENTGIAHLYGEADVTDGNLTFSAHNDGLQLAGGLRFAGTAVEIDWREAFSHDTPLQREIRLVTDSLDAALLERLGPDLRAYWAGPVGVTIEADFTRAGDAVVGLTAELDRAELTLPALRWRKDASIPGWLRTQIRLQGMQLTEIDSLAFAVGSLHGSGQVRFDPRTHTFAAADLDRLVIGRTDLHNLSVALNDEVWSVAASGGELDLAPWLDRATDTAAADTAAVSAPGPTLALTVGPVRFDRVWCTADRYLESVQLLLQRSSDRWRRIELSGRVPVIDVAADVDSTAQARNSTPNRSFVLRYGPETGATDSLRVEVGNLGALLQTVALTDNFLGGHLLVRGGSERRGSDLPIRSWVNLDRFLLRTDATAAKLFTQSTDGALVDEDDVEGISFDTLASELVWGAGSLSIESMVAKGPKVGVTCAGTIDYAADSFALHGTLIPFRAFNTLLGYIPIIGKVFSSGEGFMAADYTVTGSLADPDFAVKPFSAITPDFLKKTFGDE